MPCSKFKTAPAPAALLETPMDIAHPCAAVLKHVNPSPPHEQAGEEKELSALSELENLSLIPKNRISQTKKAKVQHQIKSSRRCCQGEEPAAALVESTKPGRWQLLLRAGSFFQQLLACTRAAERSQGNVTFIQTRSPIVLRWQRAARCWASCPEPGNEAQQGPGSAPHPALSKDG